MDDSKFHLWRACFAFCFFDNFLDSKERDWIQGKIKALPFSAAQLLIIDEDLKVPPTVEAMLPFITKPADRGFLVSNLRVLANIDTYLSPGEKEKVQEISRLVLSKIDIAKVTTDISGVHDYHSFIEALSKHIKVE